MTYRSPRTLLESMGGRAARTMRALISARQLITETYEAVERVLVRGRTTRDQNADTDDAAFDEVVAENCQPIGLVARAASDATVTAITANIGADSTNPYLIATVDGTRQLVLDARNVGGDERNLTILYTDTDVVEIRDGKIRAGSHGGPTKAVAFKDDADNLNDRITALEGAVNALVGTYNGAVGVFSTHTHAGVTTGTGTSAATTSVFPAGIPANTNTTVTGTQRFEAE